MAAFENTQGITNVKLLGRFRAYCPLGKAWYSGEVYAELTNPTYLVDYCDVDKFISRIDGTETIIEDVVAKVHSYLLDKTQSANVLVECNVKDAAHLPVTVIKEGGIGE